MPSVVSVRSRNHRGSGLGDINNIVHYATAEFSLRPSHFMNAHFLNPAYLIPLVGVSPSDQTEEAVTSQFDGKGRGRCRCGVRQQAVSCLGFNPSDERSLSDGRTGCCRLKMSIAQSAAASAFGCHYGTSGIRGLGRARYTLLRGRVAAELRALPGASDRDKLMEEGIWVLKLEGYV